MYVLALRIDQNYPTPNYLRAEDEDGNPLQYAFIKIFDALQFLAGNTDTWEAETFTNINGGWEDPAYLEEEREWVVEFSRPTTHTTTYVTINTMLVP